MASEFPREVVAAMSTEDTVEIPQMDKEQLYREEIFTDRRIGTVRRLVPVRADGAPDPERRVLFAGQAQMMTPAGTLPLSFDIDAASLEEAVAKFAAAAKDAVEHTLDELERMHREASTSILVPEPGTGGLGGRGGGKIQFP